MNANELRRGFLEFFVQRGHTIVPSDRLIPEDDPSLLFTPAGMNQFKDMFMGIGKRPYTRAASSQKCLRMPDLDRVGATASHHTFFEMLGNFSFGDYFKKEAIAWSIEYLCGELGLDFKDLAFSVYTDDDEAADIWIKQMNVPPSKLYRFGEKSNFWPAEAPSKGPNGVCGPCSEIFVDLKGGCGRPECDPDCDCGRFVEVWNLVFTQFLRKDGGVLEPLPRKNIDTGMGFERLLRVLEGAGSNFETSLFAPIIQATAGLAGKELGAAAEDDIRIKRIADHIRAAVFCVAEGIAPSNEKQGYVVRKILRRAILDGAKLGIEGPFLKRLVAPVVAVMGEPYPELADNQKRIEREIFNEEDKFSGTFSQGLGRLESMIADLDEKGRTVLDGKSAFLLYDTFGFPLDITIRHLEDRGLGVDVDGFNAAMEDQRARARAASNIADEIFDTGPLARIKGEVPPTFFSGYETIAEGCRVMAVLAEDGLVERAAQGTQASVVLDRTPFYAEGGGQVGDRGRIFSDTFSFSVTRNTVRQGDYYLHSGIVTEGTLVRGAQVRAEVAADRRAAIQRNHTATHLLHWALRRILGSHVEQAGSLVDDARLRFDFLHPAAMKEGEIERVQALVNEQIRANFRVTKELMDFKEAKAAGAMALFGEKYGDRVRVVAVGGTGRPATSIELCGGTHVESTGDIGFFKILGEESIAAGVRRIEAATSSAAEQYLNERLAVLHEAARLVKSTPDQLPKAIQDLQKQIKDLRKELARHRESMAKDQAASIVDEARDLGAGMRFMSGRVDGLGHAEMKALIDKIRGRVKSPFGIVLIARDGNKVNFVAAVDEALIARGAMPANEICLALGRKTGGGGGGRPGMAQGQGRPDGDLDALLDQAAGEAVGGVTAEP